MRIIRGLEAIPPAAKGAVLALGNFDGVHVGHEAVLAAARAEATRLAAPLGVMTFEPHPRRLFNPGLPPLRLASFAEKARLLRSHGVDFLFVARFSRAFSQITAAAFAQDVLQGRLHAAHVVTGYNFTFGHNRGGDSDILARLAAALGFGYTRCAPVEVDGQACSSSRIRTALAEGDMPTATRLLGRFYEMSGTVRHGEARGRTLGFPTANLAPAQIWLPAHGVYAVRARIGSEGEEWHDGVANLGLRPTFNGEEVRLEVHFLALAGEIYGRRLRVRLISHLRPEQKFSDIETLKAQIARDIMQARHILSEA